MSGKRVSFTLSAIIAVTIAKEGKFWPHYYYGPTTIRVTLASPNRRDLIFACKYNPHRNPLRFLKALFARIARADRPDPEPDER